MEPLRIGRPSGFLRRMDGRLLSASGRMKLLVMMLTFLFMFAVRIWFVPEEYIDIDGFNRNSEFGVDYVADNYTGKVVRNDPMDMYTREKVDLNGNEASLWEKEECSPYPPLAMFVIGGLHLMGGVTGIGLFGATALVEMAFVLMVLIYCLRTRWYLFPLIMLNVFVPFRVYVTGETTNLFILVIIMSALYAARHGRSIAHYIQAAAISFKLLPVYYLSNILRMPRRQAAVVLGILFTGLVIPVLIFEDYLYIYSFHLTRGYSFATSLFDHFGIAMSDTIAVIVIWTVPTIIATLLTIVLFYIENRMGYDWEERIGWSAIPFALLIGLRLLCTRFFFLMLLIPDKRGTRTFMVLPLSIVHMVLFFLDARPFVEYSVWDISALVVLILFIYLLLKRIGWERVRKDIGSPVRTFKELVKVRPGHDLR